MKSDTIHGRLVARQSGIYTTYVFDDLEIKHKYIMCIRLPNWECPEIKIGEIGYVKVYYVYPGDRYIDSDMNKKEYRFEQIYFDSFIRKEIKQEIKL